MRAVSEKCRYMQLPLHMRIFVSEKLHNASIKPANAKLVHKNTARHLRKRLTEDIPNAVATGIIADKSFSPRDNTVGMGGRSNVRDVRLPAAAARMQRIPESLVWVSLAVPRSSSQFTYRFSISSTSMYIVCIRITASTYYSKGGGRILSNESQKQN